MIFRIIADHFVQPIVDLLDTAITNLEGVQLMLVQGIDLGQYFGYLSFLPAPWMTLVTVLVLATALVLIVWLVKVIHGLVLTIKQTIFT